MLAIWQLMRLPTVFTGVTDVIAGQALAGQGLSFDAALVGLLITSASLYLSGMVWNDVFDVIQDSRERPARPIPSGRVSYATANKLASGLMFVGLVAAGWTTWNLGTLAPVLVAVALIPTIFAYDAWLKQTALGPLAMGLCRTLNVLLGVSGTRGHIHFVLLHPSVNSLECLVTPPALIALSNGLYIVGVTWFARSEARSSQRSGLLAGLLTAVAALGLTGTLIVLRPGLGPTPLALMTLAVVGFTIARRCLAAIREPEPRLVQLAVKTMLLSYVGLNATIVFWQTGDATLALATALLVVPALLLSRVIPMT